ncbi:MAG: hypothetical protein ACFFE8_12655 [Candidatus Heimdallarchaeota archaeon]
MAARHTLASFAFLLGISATVFFFIQQQDETALDLLFLTLYATVTIFYFLRMFFYLDHKATLNEIYFLSLANIIPLLVLFVAPMFPLGRNSMLSFVINVLPGNETATLSIGLASILAFPYLAVSSALLIRSFTRYQFIRITAQSQRGPSAEWTAIITFFIFGTLFLMVGYFYSHDLIGVLYGLFFLISGVGFVMGR